MLDLNKPVRLSDGRKARIICTDAKGDWPIIALVLSSYDESPYWFKADGISLGGQRLENIPKPRTVWININKDNKGRLHVGGAYESRILADGWGAGGVRQHILEINLDTGETKKHEV